MFNSVALDVVISLIFIYLLYSLLITIVGEMVATWLGLRARILRIAVERMLNDGQNANNQATIRSPVERWLGNSPVGRQVLRLRQWLLQFTLYEFADFKYSFAGHFYDQPSVKYLGKGEKPWALSFRHSKPAYFSAETFAETLIHLLRYRGAGSTDMERIAFCLRFNALQIESETLRHLRNLAEDSGNDSSIFSEKLKGWFEETMDRANGWYKRKLQFILFWLGFVVVLLFNVDSVTIATKLAQDKTARNELLQMAIQASDENSSISQALRQSQDPDVNRDSLLVKSYREVSRAITEADQVFGLGWDTIKAEKISFSILTWKILDQKSIHKQLNPFRIEFWGLVITALALTLGAPFWFDLLRRLVSIRGAGVNPDEENRVNKIRSPQAVRARVPANIDPAVPTDEVPAGDTVDEAIRLYSPLIHQIPGVKAVLKGFSGGDRCVQVNVADALTKQEVVRRFATLQVGTIALTPLVEVTGTPVTQQATKGPITNKSGLNGAGSVGCVLKHKVTHSRHILSCWHVMKGNLEYDKDDDSTTILDENNEDLAVRWAGGISGAFDFALARCLSPDVDNSKCFAALQFTKVRYRPVRDVDINTQKKINYYNGLNATVQKGKIYTHTPSVTIQYADRLRAVRDVLVLTADSAGPSTISQEGNSGSIVFDEEGFAIVMIIGGDQKYTYAIKLSNIFKFYNYLEIA